MRAYRNNLLAFVLTAVSLASCSTDRAPTDAGLSTALHTAVDAKRPSVIADHGERGHPVWQEAQRFYRQNGYQLAWSNGTRARAPFDSLLRALHAADREGLEPSDYHIAELDAMPRKGLTPDQAITLDLRATYAYLRYAWDLTHGTVDSEDIDPQWRPTARSVDLHNALLNALGDGSVERSLGELAPSSPQYQGLKHQLARARSGGDDQMTTVVFSPYWNIPQDIVQKEILPEVEKDPAYLEKNNIETEGESGHYRQRPGKGQPEWTPEKIAAAMQSGTEHAVKLKQPLPIYLVYFTVWEENGQLKTAPDVYGLDRRQDAAAKGQ